MLLTHRQRISLILADASAEGFLSGPLNFFKRAIPSSITATPSQTPITSQMGCDPSFVISDTTGTANASTNSLTVNDNAGNYAIAGSKIDKNAPSIATTSQAAAPYLLKRAIAGAYTCTGGVSDVSARPPRGDGANMSTASPGPRTFTVTARDNVGNSIATV
jgi:hypothetical protein